MGLSWNGPWQRKRKKGDYTNQGDTDIQEKGPQRHEHTNLLREEQKDR